MIELDKLPQVKKELDAVGCGFCLAKWTQVTMHLGSGITHSCHHVGAHKIPLDELAVNPSALHNTNFKKEIIRVEGIELLKSDDQFLSDLSYFPGINRALEIRNPAAVIDLPKSLKIKTNN